MSISESLVADFKAEAESTRRVLEAVPADRLDWKPHDKSMSLGKLASHVAETPLWAQSMLGEDLDFAATEAYQPFEATGRADLLETFEKGVAAMQAALSGKDDDSMRTTWTMRHGENVLMAVPRHLAVRSIAIHHVVHHRGQLTVYLRLLDVPVPSTYGPTADFPDMLPQT